MVIFFFLLNVNIDSLWCQNSLGTAWKHENKHNVLEYESVHVKSEKKKNPHISTMNLAAYVLIKKSK